MRFRQSDLLMSAFDPEAFLKGTAVDEAMDTKFVNVPEREYKAVSTDVKAKKSIVDGEERIILEITWEIDDPELEEVTGRKKNTVKQGIFLDITPQGGLDFGKGKNVALGKTREELGQNQPGVRWTFEQLKGKAAYVLVQHRLDSKSGETFAGVKSIRRL